jgi:hypothetical protein
VTSTDVLAKETFYGDTDLNGSINPADYTNIDNGYAMGLTGWANGDFNYDNLVNAADYSLADEAYVLQASEGSPPGTPLASALGSVAAVPEPTSLALVAISMGGLLVRRRGHR